MKFFFFIFVFIKFYWMYRVTQTWYNIQKPIFIPTIQSHFYSHYTVRRFVKLRFENDVKIYQIIKKSKISKKNFDGKEFSLMRLVDVRISLQQDSGFSLF